MHFHSRRIRIVILTAVAAASVTAFNAPTVEAFCATNVKWSSGAPHQAWAAANIPVGFRGAVQNSVVGWNNVPGSTWNVSYIAPGPLGPPANGGWISMSTPAIGFGGVPGITQVSGNPIVAANSWLNPAYTWNAAGVMNQAQLKADVTTVTLHELGHWLFLAHPSQCGAMDASEVAAVMNPQWTSKWSLNADDKAGSANMY